MTQITNEICILQLRLEFTKMLAHVRNIVRLRGFKSDTHDQVETSCINNLAQLERGGSIPLAVFEEMTAILECHKRDTYMIRPVLRLVS